MIGGERGEGALIAMHNALPEGALGLAHTRILKTHLVAVGEGILIHFYTLEQKHQEVVARMGLKLVDVKNMYLELFIHWRSTEDTTLFFQCYFFLC